MLVLGKKTLGNEILREAVDGPPTYGYRRIGALLNRERNVRRKITTSYVKSCHYIAPPRGGVAGPVNQG